MKLASIFCPPSVFGAWSLLLASFASNQLCMAKLASKHRTSNTCLPTCKMCFPNMKCLKKLEVAKRASKDRKLKASHVKQTMLVSFARRLEKISYFQNMKILYIILKHVLWRFRMYIYFREIFKFRNFMNTLRNFAKSVFAHIFAKSVFAHIFTKFEYLTSQGLSLTFGLFQGYSLRVFLMHIHYRKS